MSRIDTSGRIAEIIRRQVDALRDPVRDRSAPAGAGPKNAAGGRADLDAVIARRIRAIDNQDPDRRRKAFRVFLESVLLAELGESLINDAGFYDLVEQVQHQMSSDPSLAEAMDRAADMLLSAGPG